MKKDALVSIITPCYNGQRFVHRFLDSVLRQTYSRLELIFVDDGSTDNTADIIQSYAPAFAEKGIELHYIYQENAGQAAAVNQGLAIFKGEYMMCSDSDDWLSDDCVEKKLAYLEANPDKSFCVGKAVIVQEGQEDTVIHTFQRKNLENGWLFDDLLMEEDAYYAPGSYLVRTEAFLQANPARHIFEGMGGQNWQLLLPVAHRYECGFIDDVLYYILARQDSHSRALPTFEALMDRTHAHEDTLNAVIDSMQMEEAEREFYRRKILLKYAWNRFWLAVEYYRIDVADAQFAAYCRLEQPGLKMKIVHMLGRNKPALKCYDLVRKLKRSLMD